MADPIVINERRVQAMDRLMAACANLAGICGVEIPSRPQHLTKDHQFQAMQDLEAVAVFIEKANNSLVEKAAMVAKSLEEPKRSVKVKQSTG